MTTEYEDQVALVKWFDLWAPKPLRGRLASVPNASLVPVWVGKKMNLSGRRAGFPDLMLLAPSNGYHGLVIELKRKTGGVTSAEQKDWIAWLNEQGYCATVCKGFEAAKITIEMYLEKR